MRPVEKAIRNAGLGINPIVDGQMIRLPIPDLTEERRKELAKLAGQYAEKARIAVRNVRRDGMDALKTDEKKHEISEDEHKRLEHRSAEDDRRHDQGNRCCGAHEGTGNPRQVTSNPAATGGAPLHDGAGGEAPRHVAIIMDGNGRWAAKRGLPRVAGHRAGAEAVRRTLKAAVRNGVEVLTLYAFSSENWRRSEEEVSDLKGLLGYYLERELDELAREGVQLRLIGDPTAFGPQLVERLERAVERTAANDRLILVVALNYGSRAEIAGAARRLAEQAAAGALDPAAIDEARLGAELDDQRLARA